MSEHSNLHAGQCYCGKVHVEVEGDPVFAAYCHCESCRKWHSAPMTALAAWPEDSVKVHGTTTVSDKNDESQRTSCARCGGNVLTTKPGMGWKIVYPLTLSGSDFSYNPAMHTFYDERVVDFNDGLPKFSDVPAEAGGSGVMIDEPSLSGWRS
ncbi:MAG: GFA family protein [Boseongicola sp.]|nr:MAG: GFA family protein [Boseongicola sp.]